MIVSIAQCLFAGTGPDFTISCKFNTSAAARRLPNYANPPPSTDLMKRGTIELKGVK